MLQLDGKAGAFIPTACKKSSAQTSSHIGETASSHNEMQASVRTDGAVSPACVPQPVPRSGVLVLNHPFRNSDVQVLNSPHLKGICCCCQHRVERDIPVRGTPFRRYER